MSAMQKMSVKAGEEVPLKFALMRCGKLMQLRRVTLLRPTLANVTEVLRGWVNGSFGLQYTDEDEDTVQLGSEAEWTECLRLWREGIIGGPNSLQVSVCVGGRCPAKVGGVGRPRAAESERCQPLSVESRSYRRCADGAMEEGADVMQEVRMRAAATNMMERLLGPGALGHISTGAIGVEELSRLGWVQLKQEAGGVELDFDMDRLAREMHRRAHDAFDTGDFGVAADCFQLLSDLQPGVSNHLYNLACARSQQGQTAGALEALSMAIVLGYKDLKHMETDGDLERVRTEKPGEWKALREQVQGKEDVKAEESGSEASSWCLAEREAGSEEQAAVEPEAATGQNAAAAPSAPQAVREEKEEEKEDPAAEAQPQDLRRVVYSEQIEVLREMGVAEDVALEILDSFGGNLERTVQELFAM